MSGTNSKSDPLTVTSQKARDYRLEQYDEGEHVPQPGEHCMCDHGGDSLATTCTKARAYELEPRWQEIPSAEEVREYLRSLPLDVDESGRSSERRLQIIAAIEQLRTADSLAVMTERAGRTAESRSRAYRIGLQQREFPDQGVSVRTVAEAYLEFLRRGQMTEDALRLAASTLRALGLLS